MKYKTFLVAMLILPLSACLTAPGRPPVIITNTCNPPIAFTTKHSDLPKVLQTKLTEKQVIDLWLDDIQAYNDLNVDHSSLIDWVQTHCK